MSLHPHEPTEHVGGDRPHCIRLFGEIDMATAPILTTQLRSLPAGVDVELDLSRVRFMSAAGLTLLLALRRQIARGGARLYLTAVPSAIDRMFVLVGLREVLLDAPSGCAGGSAELSAVVIDFSRARPRARVTRLTDRRRVEFAGRGHRPVVACLRSGRRSFSAGKENHDDVD